MNVTPVVFRPVPAVFPVAKVGPARTEEVGIQAVTGTEGQGRKRSPPRRPREHATDTTPAHPAASLARMLAVLALDKVFNEAGVAP